MEILRLKLCNPLDPELVKPDEAVLQIYELAVLSAAHAKLEFLRSRLSSSGRASHERGEKGRKRALAMSHEFVTRMWRIRLFGGRNIYMRRHGVVLIIVCVCV